MSPSTIPPTAPTLALAMPGRRTRPKRERAAGRGAPAGARGFFVEPEAWRTLEDLVIEPLVRAKAAEDPIRVWVPGAGAGESAYGVAMLLLERMEAEGKDGPVHVFATDTSPELRRLARAARYPSRLLRHVSPERRRRFFYADGGGMLTVRPAVRSLV